MKNSRTETYEDGVRLLHESGSSSHCLMSFLSRLHYQLREREGDSLPICWEGIQKPLERSSRFGMSMRYEQKLLFQVIQ